MSLVSGLGVNHSVQIRPVLCPSLIILDLLFVYVQEYRPYQYNINWLPVHLRQLALLQHNHLSTGWLLYSDLSFLSVQEYRPYQYDISRLSQCAYLHQQALLRVQHNLLPSGWLLSSDLPCLFWLFRSIVPTSATSVGRQSAPTATDTPTTLPSAYRTTTIQWLALPFLTV
jgi:hypothetical protein